MKFLTGSIVLFFSLLFIAANSESPQVKAAEPVQVAQKDKAKEEPKHARGYKAPVNLKALIKASWERHGKHLQAIPHVTAASWDSRTLGIICPAWDQGPCGSCWAHGGTRVCTTALVKGGQMKVTQLLSRKYTMDCYENGGCNGDTDYTVLTQCKSGGSGKPAGIPLDSDYGPYTPDSSRCTCSPNAKLYTIADQGFVGSEEGIADTQAIKDCIVKYGCVGTAVAAGGDWDNIGGGTITGNSTNINHDVVFIGWDDDHDNGDGTKGAWRVMNSWGESYAAKGVLWVKYKADSIGTSACWAVATGGPVPPIPPVPPGPGPLPPVAPDQVTIAHGGTTLVIDSANRTITSNATDGYKLLDGKTYADITGLTPTQAKLIQALADEYREEKKQRTPDKMPMGPIEPRKLGWLASRLKAEK